MAIFNNSFVSFRHLLSKVCTANDIRRTMISGGFHETEAGPQCVPASRLLPRGSLVYSPRAGYIKDLMPHCLAVVSLSTPQFPYITRLFPSSWYLRRVLVPPTLVVLPSFYTVTLLHCSNYDVTRFILRLCSVRNSLAGSGYAYSYRWDGNGCRT